MILTYQGAPGDLIKAAVDAGAKGVVIAGAGAGAMSGTQSEGVDYAAQKGVFVVTATRTGSGRIAPPSASTSPSSTNPTPAQQRRREFSISAEDHAPLKARILLMLALDEDDRPRQNSADFSRNTDAPASGGARRSPVLRRSHGGEFLSNLRRRGPSRATDDDNRCPRNNGSDDIGTTGAPWIR